MSSHRFPKLLAAAFAIGIVPALANAATISGEFNVNGDLQLAGLSDVDFLPSGGTFTVGLNPTGSFASLAGTTGTLKDLVGDPIGSTFSLTDFMILAGLAGVSFELQEIFPGLYTDALCAAAPAAGQSCTPAGSEYSFVNTQTGSTVSFSGAGIVHSGADESSFTGVFTAQFNEPYQTVLADIAAGGSEVTTHSGSLKITALAGPGVGEIPEPVTWALMILSFSALGWQMRARRWAKA